LNLGVNVSTSSVKIKHNSRYSLLLGSGTINLSVLAGEVANLAGRRERSRARRLLATDVGVEMGTGISAGTIDGESLGVDMVV
jgi:hypothetical protein